MSFFDTLILNIIFILFPIAIVFILKAHNSNVGKINNEYLIDIANFSCTFLLIKYCNYDLVYNFILVNIPFIISVLYKRRGATVILSFVLILFYYFNDYNLYITIFEYIIYLVLFFGFRFCNKSYNFILSVFLFIKGFSISASLYYIVNSISFLIVFGIFISLVIFYLISFVIIKIINLMEEVISINQTLKELEREKNLKNSLFKITHEVKNPIAVCKGYLSMMNYDDLDTVKKYNEIIESELNRTLDIMDNFSEYTKIKVNLDIMDLDCLISDILNNTQTLFKSYGVEVNCNSLEDVYINGDYSRLKQVFVNILKNSCEAIDKEGVIDINVCKKKKYVYISIKDNGSGMNEEELSKMEQLFYTSKEKGCGVGVALSKEIIRLHNGELSYSSVLGEYTEAKIKLPILDM